jgi:hypothetical protein
MMDPRVVVVILRRPRSIKVDHKEMRSDPFWEFGSFGCTHCHERNIMNPRKAHILNGMNLAFAQGGNKGFRLVYLTPPIKVLIHNNVAEARWSPASMPFRYDEAPVLVDNHGNSSFPLFKNFLIGTKRKTWEGRLSSKFRSRREPVPQEIGREITESYYILIKSVDRNLLASTYTEALPYPPPKVDHDRLTTYRQLLNEACGMNECKYRGAPIYCKTK